jgi:hypothetical protein
MISLLIRIYRRLSKKKVDFGKLPLVKEIVFNFQYKDLYVISYFSNLFRNWWKMKIILNEKWIKKKYEWNGRTSFWNRSKNIILLLFSVKSIYEIEQIHSKMSKARNIFHSLYKSSIEREAQEHRNTASDPFTRRRCVTFLTKTT